MLTELQQRKLIRLFHVYDANRDGVLERGDYERVATGIADFLEIPLNSAERESHFAGYMASWDGLQQLADTDNDNQVTLDEWIAANAAIIAQSELLEMLVRGSTESTMNWEDKDRDGRIARAEYLGVAQSYAMTQEEAEEAFQHLDRDGDGYIDKDEMMLDTLEFFTSDDPDAPGNWLVGRF
ncbi:MAG: EF-hand domain-containing protein [Anaerolineae bacterium]|nr:EF-hand domain-containing protein [Anaerolineae bacterium]